MGRRGFDLRGRPEGAGRPPVLQREVQDGARVRKARQPRHEEELPQLRPQVRVLHADERQQRRRHKDGRAEHPCRVQRDVRAAASRRRRQLVLRRREEGRQAQALAVHWLHLRHRPLQARQHRQADLGQGEVLCRRRQLRAQARHVELRGNQGRRQRDRGLPERLSRHQGRRLRLQGRRRHARRQEAPWAPLEGGAHRLARPRLRRQVAQHPHKGAS